MKPEREPLQWRVGTRTGLPPDIQAQIQISRSLMSSLSLLDVVGNGVIGDHGRFDMLM